MQRPYTEELNPEHLSKIKKSYMCEAERAKKTALVITKRNPT